MPITHLLTQSFYKSITEPPKDEIIHQVQGHHNNEHVDFDYNRHNYREHDVGMEYYSKRAEIDGFTAEINHEEKILLIDTDGGTEDAWAIFMALGAHRDSSSSVRVVGISCVYGNTSVDNVTANVTRILNTVNEKKIPVFKGMGTSMVTKFEHFEKPFNGFDGFGDSKLPPVAPIVEKEHAVNAVIKLAETYKGRLSIVCLGPLTNIAMAIKMKPDITNYIKELIVIGGNTHGIENQTCSSEFNFFVDPEAASVVLESLTYCPIYVLPYATCEKSATSSYSWRLNSLGNMRTREMSLLNKIEGKILDKYRDGWSAHDAIAVACFLNSHVMKKTENLHCSVELHGNHTRGLMVVDRNFLMQKPANVIVIEEVDREIYEKMLVWAAGGPTY